MSLSWTTPAGLLAVLEERISSTVSIEAASDVGTVSYTLITGGLPRGMRLENSAIVGAPVEVRKETESKFVIRASDGQQILDRTFIIIVQGEDKPVFNTPEGFLQVGNGEAYFVLDNAQVNFQLEAFDPDITAGEILKFFLVLDQGELPPGLTLSESGVISGFTDAILSTKFQNTLTGAYDTHTFDTVPLDLANKNTNGFDSYLFDTQTFDFNNPSQIPKRLSRIYTFSIGITDGLNIETRLFKIYVVSEEFLKADNNLVQVDTNLFRADSASQRFPIWITDSYLGRYRANNYVTLFLDVYDPPTLTGILTYLRVAKNPDGSDSEFPPGMTLDTTTGEIAGVVPYQTAITKQYQFTLIAIDTPTVFPSGYTLQGDWNSLLIYDVTDSVRYDGRIWFALKPNGNVLPEEGDVWTTGTASTEKTFSVDIIGELESAITWVSDSDLGTIRPNQPSQIFVNARATTYGGRIRYEVVAGSLPPGLGLIDNGLIQGKVNQFADSDNIGLTRFYFRDPSIEDSTGSFNYSVIFDGEQTSFDKIFRFTVRARDYAQFAEVNKDFFIKVIAENNKTFANLYVKAFQSKNKRLEWFGFITSADIFDPDNLYRIGDRNFGVQTEIKVLVYAGIESVEAVNYVQAMSRNHHRKRFLLGDLRKSKAKDPVTQETIYEVIYVDVVDTFEKDRKSISNEIQLRNDINSKVLVSYNAIKIDSDIPLVSDSDHQRVFPNSVKNMRDRISAVGDRDREFLPIWMRSIQDTALYELGYTKALVLCYAKPGRGDFIISRIKNSNFDFKTLDFESDRYIIDIIDGEIEDKYLAFPQRDVLNKLANPSAETTIVTPSVFGSFDSNTVTFDNAALTFDQG